MESLDPTILFLGFIVLIMIAFAVVLLKSLFPVKQPEVHIHQIVLPDSVSEQTGSNISIHQVPKDSASAQAGSNISFMILMAFIAGMLLNMFT